MIRTTSITDEVRAVLGGITWHGSIARLPAGQLERKLYQRVNDVLESLGGKWNRKDKGHTFPAEAAEELEALIEHGAFITEHDRVQTYGEFFTPDGLADELISQLPDDLSGSVLEPSAGEGRLVSALHRRYGDRISVFAVEIQDRYEAALRSLPNVAVVTVGDFLAIQPVELHSAVAMNPPHAKQVDIDHVLHAWQFLKPGGTLAAIVSAGWTWRDNRKSVEFRQFVDEHGTWEPIDRGAFSGEGEAESWTKERRTNSGSWQVEGK